MIRMEVSGPVTKRCPYKEERDDGTVTYIFEMDDEDGPELHSLADGLSLWRDEPVSHEEFTAEQLRIYSDRGCVEVRTTWQTAGLDVIVTARP